MWKNTEQLNRPHTVWRMPTACWIFWATNAHSEYIKTCCLSTAAAVAQSVTTLRCLVEIWQVQENFLFSKVSKEVLGLTCPLHRVQTAILLQEYHK
jgi:hypothetical protein